MICSVLRAHRSVFYFRPSNTADDRVSTLPAPGSPLVTLQIRFVVHYRVRCNTSTSAYALNITYVNVRKQPQCVNISLAQSVICFFVRC